MTECPINLDCSMMPASPEGYCENKHYCNHWAYPWPLPYYYDYSDDAMVVSIWVPHIYTDQYTEEVRASGYFEAQKLPYSGKKGHLEVTHYSRELGFYPAEELPYKWEDGAMIVEHSQKGFRPAEPLPFEIDKDGMRVTRTAPDYYKPVWAIAEELQYNYNRKTGRLTVRRNEPGFARAWPLSSKRQHHHNGLPLLTDHYPRPNNWLFKKELAERGLKLRPDQKPSAYFLLYSRHVALWDAGECDRI